MNKAKTKPKLKAASNKLKSKLKDSLLVDPTSSTSPSSSTSRAQAPTRSSTPAPARRRGAVPDENLLAERGNQHEESRDMFEAEYDTDNERE